VLVRAVNNPNQRLLVFGVFGVFAGGLLFLLFMLTRPKKKLATGSGFLAESTGAINIAEMQAQAAAMQKAAPKSSPTSPASTRKPEPADDGGLTSAVPAMMRPPASIYVEGSRDAANIGRNIGVSKIPFTLGRKQRDINFDNDDNVSRNHAEIIYADGRYMLHDSNSTHGTFIDNNQVPPGTSQPLYNGCKIRLGTTTILVFTLQTGNTSDPDVTSPEMPGFNNRR
jgi:hypothetical protein